MPLVTRTHSGLTIAVLDFRPDWQAGFQVTATLPGEIATGLTGRENRTVGADSLRWSATCEAHLDSTPAADLRQGLATLGTTLVGLPLWPDLLAGAAYPGARLWAPRLLWDPAAQEIRPHDHTLSPTALYAPLLVGRLDNLPALSTLHATAATAPLALTEDSPWACRVDLAATASPGVWPSTLVPDRATPTRDQPLSALAYEPLGRGRTRATTGEEEAFRWAQEAEFALTTRGQISALLAFFAASRGTQLPFEQPWWFTPGTTTPEAPHATTARFAQDRLTLSFATPAVATTTVRVLQVPWEIAATPGETPVQAPRAAYYKFTYLIPSAPVWRFTDWERDLTRTADGTYTSGLFSHRALRTGLQLEGEEIELTSTTFPGNPLLYAQPHLREARLLLEYREGDPADPDSAQLVFAGEVRAPKFAGKRITATAVWLGGLLERPVATMLVQRQCNTWLFSTACGLSKAAYAQTGTLTSLTGAVLTVATATTAPAGTFAGGWIEVGAGLTWERRTIKASTPGTGLQTLTIDRPLRQAPTGQTVTFYRGCDGAPATCQALGNYANFRGFPFTPRDNPTLTASTANNTPRKK